MGVTVYKATRSGVIEMGKIIKLTDDDLNEIKGLIINDTSIDTCNLCKKDGKWRQQTPMTGKGYHTFSGEEDRA